MTNTLVQEYESVRETFRVWHAEQESLDAQLAESLAALTAYQSHLDSWQQQLARERAELQARCEELTRERADFETTKAAAEHTSAEAGEELRAAREKIAVLSSSLSERTEEFRTVDQQRSELAAELELISTREKELKLALDEQKRTLEVERTQWAEEQRQLRQMLERRDEADVANANDVRAEPRPAIESPPLAARGKGSHVHSENPVLGSIMEQFGKLRQQRASDRAAQRKAR
jgi:chromosome segregation ATPase